MNVAHYCDRMVMALSEAGYPPSTNDGTWAEWSPSPPFEVVRRADEICGQWMDLDDEDHWDEYGAAGMRLRVNAVPS